MLFRSLKDEASGRQVKGAEFGLVTGLGGLTFGGNLVNSFALILSSEVPK